MQLVTRNNELQTITHDWEFMAPSLEPVSYPVPDKGQFAKETVKLLSMIVGEIFKLAVDGKEYCLKSVYREGDRSLIQELEALSTLPAHPNIIALKGVVVDEDGRIEGLLLPLIVGKPLSDFTNLTRHQASKWKSEIAQAVLFLHNNKTIWGDAKPGNIMVNRKIDSICLIDFGGGTTPGWVDYEIYGTFEGDDHGVKRIHSFIENLVDSN